MQPKRSYSLSHGDFVPESQSVQRDFVSLGLMGFQPMAPLDFVSWAACSAASYGVCFNAATSLREDAEGVRDPRP